MYLLQERSYGFELVFSGHLGIEEMRRWIDEVSAAVGGARRRFGIMLDLRHLMPPSLEIMRLFAAGMRMLEHGGLVRSAVIVLTSETREHYTRLSLESGAHRWERFFNTENNPAWYSQALTWIDYGVEQHGARPPG
jgi:hypothetical protein